jgi:inner membrane transporter RhtA
MGRCWIELCGYGSCFYRDIVNIADASARSDERPTLSGRLVSGVTLSVASSLSNQAGAAVGALAFPMIGAVGVVAVRQLVAAIVLGAVARPRWRSVTRQQWVLVLGLALALGVMNLALYAAIDRIGLALAVTLEFLGPLAVAVAGSRKLVDFVCLAAAAVGVVVLMNPGTLADLFGVALALTAAACWAAYILLNRAIGGEIPGVQGSAMAAAVSAVAWVPIGLAWFVQHPPTPAALLLAGICAIASSVVPFAVDLIALRRVSATLFSALTSLNPVWAALLGWVILEQVLSAREVIGIAMIVGSNVVATLSALRSK